MGKRRQSVRVLLTVLVVVVVVVVCSGEDESRNTKPIIRRFQRYLRFKTAHPNPNYSAPVAFLKSEAESMGLDTRILEFVTGKPVLIVSWPGSRPELPCILFNSHLDSVPAEADKWSQPPFGGVHTADGKIFGRGSQDDKSIGLQYLEAIRNLRESSSSSFEPVRTVRLSYVPDEEIGGIDGAAKLTESKEFQELNVGFVMDEGQASPTDEFRVFYADRSPWHVTIKATGPPGHGSRMYDHSAMENLFISIESITKFRESQFDLVKRGLASYSQVISVNPVFLDAGISTSNSHSQEFAMNMQPSEALAGFDIRLPPTVDPQLVRDRIAHDWAPASRNMSFQIDVKGPIRDFWGHPLMTSTEDTNPWWSVFVQAIRAAGGKLGKPEILASTTDAKFMRQMGIPTLGFSPMSNTPILLHDHNEFLQDDVYLRGIKVYESIISHLSSFEGVDK